MRILVFAFIGLVAMSCSDGKDLQQAFKTESVTYSLKNAVYRRAYAKMSSSAYYNENPEKYGEAHAAAMTLDTLANAFNTLADSILAAGLSVQSQQVLKERYNAIFHKIDSINTQNYLQVENPDSIGNAGAQLNLDEEMVLYLKLNMEQAVSMAMEYLTSDMSSGCGFSSYQIEFRQEGENTIALGNKAFQGVAYRQIQLTAITKDGKLQTLHPRISNDYTFGKITFDTLAPGAYTVKGDVHMLIGDSRFSVVPFEYSFEAE